ncbi:proprotein convertase P-domain-containing protein [Arcicella sp. LKC2W]|uniref:proprotein convertase P-domain-containing protein n=1 Tax=Arcicella sp. LKC2W TaxID=2984198 RepID=UPI002B208635|nr:proprotein convertase P-domain-containing protein [Arcicella sp. LKC2W]MEA5457731.1 proprotein convertase P-domain-containing protein [Arcicella sp. LKC2W]
MIKICRICLWISILFCTQINAQQFIGNGGSIRDFKNFVRPDTFNIKINGLPKLINSAFGLSKVCFNITHSRASDLKIELISPSGISIWLTNRNGRDNGRDYMNTCFRSNGFSGYIHQANAPFEGEFIPDGRFSFLNNGQNPNGTWKLLISDLREEEVGTLNYISLEFTENPMPNQEASPCSFENPEGCKCDTKSKDCELLPDLIILKKFTEQQIKEYPKDDPYYGGQLHFAASICNIGDGPMETNGMSEWLCGDEKVDSLTKCADGKYARQKVYQRIYSKKGNKLTFKDRLAGTNYFDDKPGHNHFHVDDWVEFRLVKETITKRKKTKTLVAKGRKVSYCLFDSGVCSNRDNLCEEKGKVYGEKNLSNYGLGNYTECKSKKQGISVGGYDTYGMLYEGQFIQLPKGLKSGEYILEIEIDPNHIYKEKDSTNNTFKMKVQISKQE